MEGWWVGSCGVFLRDFLSGVLGSWEIELGSLELGVVGGCVDKFRGFVKCGI